MLFWYLMVALVISPRKFCQCAIYEPVDSVVYLVLLKCELVKMHLLPVDQNKVQQPQM